MVHCLTSKTTNKITSNTSGTFTDLTEQTYNLEIKTSPSCIVKYPKTIVLNKTTCNETFISPNGDGDHDSYTFESSGTVSIYNKNGILVNKFNAPYTWDGTDFSGKLVDVGLYFIYINNEKKSTHISVVY
jgi:hypothetical protein